MINKIYRNLIFFIFAILFVLNTKADTAIPQFSSMVFAGYQGWFITPNSGVSGIPWNHWSGGAGPAPGMVAFEVYPDVREFPVSALSLTHLGNLGNGAPSTLYDAGNSYVIDTHMKWMKQYGIDGPAVQRFLGPVSRIPQLREQYDKVLGKVKKSAEQYGRHFYVNYDISGSADATVFEDIKYDLENHLQNGLNVFSSPSYARQNAKPVIGIWGFGFIDRNGTPAIVAQIVQWLKQKGFYVLGGVPTEWRIGGGTSKPGWLNTYLQYDMIQPWTVGSYMTDQDVKNHYAGLMMADLKFCQQKKIGYQTVIYPGFSWSNWNGGARNLIPRRNGDFLWRQAYYVRAARIGTMIAMFDEFDEGTAISKAAENASMIPTNQYFYTLDSDGKSLSSDFYLRLSGAATQMIKGTRGLTFNVPISPR